MKEPLEFRKIRDFGDIINDSIAFIGQNWKPLLKSVAVICGFFILASLAMSIVEQMKLMNIMNDKLDVAKAYQNYGSSPFATIFTWSYFLTLLLNILTYTSIPLTIYCFITLYVEKGNTAPEVEEVWSYFKFYFWRVFGSGILLGIGFIIAFIMCVIPGIYLLPAFSLVVPIIVLENGTLGYSFSRSFQLVKDNYWLVLGIIVVVFIIYFTASFILVLPINIITVGSVVTTGHKLTTTYVILNSIAAHISIVFSIINPIAVAVCYYSLTEQKEGTGLMDRIEQLGKADNNQEQASSEEY